MRAILLAAGLGTRLRPLTNTVPKCLVPIHGKPLLGIWLERLSDANIGPFLINTHYLADQVEAFASVSPYRDEIKLASEKNLLGTAGTLISNLDFFGNEDGMLIHADNYCLADFRSFLEAHHHRPEKCVMTMMTFRTNNPSACGIVQLDEDDIVVEFHEKVPSPPGNLANGAIYILSSELTRALRDELGSAKDFSTEIIGKFIGRIYAYETKDTFVDIGTPEDYKRVNS